MGWARCGPDRHAFRLNGPSPFPSHDGLSLYFSRLYADTYFYARIFQAKRDQPSGPFTSVEQVLSSSFHVEFPWVSTDNLRMYYTNELPTGWVIRMGARASEHDPWPEGPVLTELSALGVSVLKAALTSDERTIFFTSVHGAPGGQGGWEMWMATRPDLSSPFGGIRNLSEINGPYKDQVGSASPDGLTLYFQSDRNGTTQFFRATRHALDAPFETLEHLSFFDGPDGAGAWPTISSDGSALYLGRGANGGPADLWVSYLGSVVCGEDGAGCDDQDGCTRTDVCSAGACIGSNTVKADGTVCDDASLCTTGETCQDGTCTPAFSGLNRPKPKSSGYYKKLCEKRAHNPLPYQGEQLRDADAVCVGAVTSTFAGISTVDDLCDVIDTGHHGGRHRGGPGDGPNGKDCDKGENELIATALNICRARVCEEQNLDSRCHGNTHTTVRQSFADADAILDDAARDKDTCKSATCELREINNGHALEMNSLVLHDESGAPTSYELWRRAMGSNDAFVKIGTTARLTFLDTTVGTAVWEYDVTAVFPGD